MTNSNVYPGMVDKSLEFFQYENELKFMKNGEIKSYSDLSFSDIGILKDAINSNKEVKLALHDMHPFSESKRIEQFAICQFSGLDKVADIKGGVLQDGEYWSCPKRGSCPHEGLLCKLPVVNNERLTNQDVTLIQLSCTEMTNEVIAEKLDLALGTFHLFKKNLYRKIGVQTKQGCAIVGQFFNLI